MHKAGLYKTTQNVKHSALIINSKVRLSDREYTKDFKISKHKDDYNAMLKGVKGPVAVWLVF